METTEKPAAGETTSGGSSEVVELKCQQKVADGDKAEAGNGKKIASVSQKYIDNLLKEKATGTGMYRPSRLMKYVEDGHDSVDLRPFVARINAIREEVRAGDAAILEQCHRLGYAYGEVEDGSWVNDEKVYGPLARTRPLPRLA